jgi:hypothetical protein
MFWYVSWFFHFSLVLNNFPSNNIRHCYAIFSPSSVAYCRWGNFSVIINGLKQSVRDICLKNCWCWYCKDSKTFTIFHELADMHLSIFSFVARDFKGAVRICEVDVELLLSTFYYYHGLFCNKLKVTYCFLCVFWYCRKQKYHLYLPFRNCREYESKSKPMFTLLATIVVEKKATIVFWILQ